MGELLHQDIAERKLSDSGRSAGLRAASLGTAPLHPSCRPQFPQHSHKTDRDRERPLTAEAAWHLFPRASASARFRPLSCRGRTLGPTLIDR